MQLADALWRHVEPHQTADMHAWEQALAHVRADVDTGLERTYSLMPTGQQKALRAVATDASVYGNTASLLDLPPGTARDAANTLTDNGILRRHNDQLAVIDPLLADWLQRRFPI